MEVSLLVIRNLPYVFKKLTELRWEDLRRKELLGLDLELVLHHLLQAILISFVAPWKLADAEVAEQEEERLDVVLLEVLFVWEMGSEGGVHCRADHSKVVLLLDHELFEGLHGRFLLAGFGVDDVLGIVVGAAAGTAFALGSVDGRVGAALFFGQAEIYKIYKMGLIRIVADHYVGRFQVPVDVTLRVDARQAVHQLQSDDYYGLDLELAFFERFFQFFEVYT